MALQGNTFIEPLLNIALKSEGKILLALRLEHQTFLFSPGCCTAFILSSRPSVLQGLGVLERRPTLYRTIPRIMSLFHFPYVPLRSCIPRPISSKLD